MQAGQSQRKDASRTYVVCDGDQVLGYYSLCAFSVSRAESPSPARIGASPVPAVLLARLAVDQRSQRGGIGGTLLLHALGVAAKVADAIGARMMVVHALHEQAAEYYQNKGFKPFETNPLMLYLPMQDIRRTLELAGLL